MNLLTIIYIIQLTMVGALTAKQPQQPPDTNQKPQQPQGKYDLTEIKSLLEKPQVQLEPESAKSVAKAMFGERKANEKFEEMLDFYVSLVVQEGLSICRTSFLGACPAMPNWSRCEPSFSICANDFGLTSQCKMHIADTVLNTTSTVLGALGPLGGIGATAEKAAEGTKHVEAAVKEAKEAWNMADIIKKMQIAVKAGEAKRGEMNLAAKEASDKLDENTKKAKNTVLAKIDDDFSDAPDIANDLVDAVNYLALSKIANAKQEIATAKLEAIATELGGAAVSLASAGLGSLAASLGSGYAEAVNQYEVPRCVYEANPETVAFLKQENFDVGKLKAEVEKLKTEKN